MQTSLVMTIIGRDRPGLVESVAALVARHGGNWLESRMARLGGQFAGILQVELPATAVAAVVSDLNALKSHGLSVVVQEDATPPAPAGAQTRQIEIVGHDRPGIVREISGALAGRGVNVEEFSSERISAAMSGEQIFRARATVNIPGDVDLAALQRDLEKIGHDLIVDVSLKPGE